MKLKNTILDKQLNLIGFVVEGKETEFGGIADSIVTQIFSGREMVRLGFVNSQIDTRSGKVKCLGDFKIKQLQPKVMVDNSLYDIDSTITLTKRILYNGVLKGFEVQCSDGTCVRMTYDSVVRSGAVLNGSNFVIRRGKNRDYVVGTQGSIKELPEIELGRSKETSSRKRSGVSGKQVDEDNIALEHADLMSLYELVESVDGIVVKLPSERYESRTSVKTSYDESFKSLGLGEVGQPRLDFGEKKLNANTNFKNLGLVTVAVNGVPTPVYSFTYSTKTIFAGLENHMKHFVIGVTADIANQIDKVYGNNLIVNTINDVNITKPIATITGKELVYFEVDTSHLKLISDNRAKQIASTPIKEIGNLVYNLAILKARTKLLKDISKEAIELGNIAKDEINTIAPLFKGFNAEYLSAFKEAGIDIYTGAFTKQVIADGKKEDKKEGERDATIELEIKGLDNRKLTLKNIKEVLNNEGKADSRIVEIAGLIEIARVLYGESNYRVRLAKAQQIKKEIDRDIREIVKRLWIWKVSIVTIGDNKVANTGNWEAVISRAKDSLVYESKDVGGLKMKLTGIQLGDKIS